MRRSPKVSQKKIIRRSKRQSPKQALHTRFSPKMEIIGRKSYVSSASDSLMLPPSQGIFGALTKGIGTVNKALDKGQKYYDKAQQVYNQLDCKSFKDYLMAYSKNRCITFS